MYSRAKVIFMQNHLFLLEVMDRSEAQVQVDKDSHVVLFMDRRSEAQVQVDKDSYVVLFHL